MIQSHYVPLERPYRIIYAGGVVGLQIGTLIVVDDQTPMVSQTVSSQRDYRSAMFNYIGNMGIKTYSHPVVSYINKSDNGKRDLMSDAPYGGTYSEAVVWNQVEQRDVMTICLEGDKLHWAELREFLFQKVSTSKDRDSALEIMISIGSMVDSIISLGGKFVLPAGNVIHVQLLKGVWEDDESGSREPGFHTNDDVLLPFIARTNDVEEAYVIMFRQLHHYRRILKKINPQRKFSFVFENQIDKLLFPDMYDEVQKLVDALNNQ